MRITVGSQNQTKIDAVRQAIVECALFQNAEVVGVDVNHETFGHPIGFEAVITGAKDRAQQAFVDADYSFGIESGLVEIPHTKSGYMEVTMCAIYDGEQFHLGLSPGFEWPRSVTSLIVDDGLDGSQAFKAAGLTTEEKIGASQGGIHFLTKGRMNRTGYNKIVVMMALLHLENKEHYQ